MDGAHASLRRVREFAHGLVRQHLRVGQSLVDLINRRKGHIRLLKAHHPLRPCARRKTGGQCVPQDRIVLHSLCMPDETRIAGEFPCLQDRRHQRFPKHFSGRKVDRQQLAIRAAKHKRLGSRRSSKAVGHDSTLHEMGEGALNEGHRRFEHVDLDAMAVSGLCAIVERAENGKTGIHPRHVVGNRRSAAEGAILDRG